ncbi:hypothetical protein I0C86_41555 [Plantactinospora sp. S1510]|uniref:Uncharacterized protein n=1 Tax=Plantactinospora alkalitolerans TaxID=2789879 RepID=A0ABS0HA48_9ACTN|nr:hypothetical protein [Plantactinospora alkalitolerans]MBF9135340.1 hypothetical protein [Plantactinospora alkalitolerans]
MGSLTARDALTSDWTFFVATGAYFGCVAAYSAAPRWSTAERAYLAGVAAVPALLAARAAALGKPDDYAMAVCWLALTRAWAAELADAIAPTLYRERGGRRVGELALAALGWVVAAWPRHLEWIVGPRLPEESPQDPPGQQVRRPPGGA